MKRIKFSQKHFKKRVKTLFFCYNYFGDFMKKKYLIITFVFFLIDLVSKQILSRVLELGKSIKVIKNFFYITLAHNDGAAFSILRDKQILLIIVTVIALFFIYK